jgi:hypothetical protein
MVSVQDQFDAMFSNAKESLARLTIGREELADATVRQSDWRGDHCGYLAAQCKARTLRGLKPTAEQAEAWLVCNTNEVQLFKGAI